MGYEILCLPNGGSALTLVAGAISCFVQEACGAEEDDGPVIILDTTSTWRLMPVLRPPVVELDRGVEPLLSGKVWLDKETAPPPQDWTEEPFADATWLRGAATRFPKTPYLSSLCLRARFKVTDPSAVENLTLSLAYYGGAIVYVNGHEITRGSVPPGSPAPDALAEGYPVEAFITEKGDLVPPGWRASHHKAALASRERKLNDVAIPASALRKGTNVLAVRVIRAPYHKVLDQEQYRPSDKEVKTPNCPYNFTWNTCELRAMELRAGASRGIEPNAARPAGLQAWNSGLLAMDSVEDFGDRCEPLRPVLIQGPRNGWASGKVVLGSPAAIEDLRVTVSDLKQGAATIPAGRVRVRFAIASDLRTAAPLDALLESPLPLAMKRHDG